MTESTNGMKWLALDGAMLGFDRRTGRNLLLRGEQTAHCQQIAPRVVQMSITNACNKTCGFCYRPLDAKSEWRFESIIEFGNYLAQWGVLELALGGGEPTVFPRFTELCQRLWDDTGLGINFTTNGTRLTPALLRELRGCVGQIQVSVYEDEDVDSCIDLLVSEQQRFGLNYLVTPGRLRTLDADLMVWAERGVKDVLLLSYKGTEALHLNDDELRDLDERIVRCQELLQSRLQLKVDVCWSSRLKTTPQLFFDEDCRAGSLFLSVTSDRKVLSCSFADGARAFRDFDELPGIYKELKAAKLAAPSPGCARLPNFGQLIDGASLLRSRRTLTHAEL